MHKCPVCRDCRNISKENIYLLDSGGTVRQSLQPCFSLRCYENKQNYIIAHSSKWRVLAGKSKHHQNHKSTHSMGKIFNADDINNIHAQNDKL